MEKLGFFLYARRELEEEFARGRRRCEEECCERIKITTVTIYSTQHQDSCKLIRRLMHGQRVRARARNFIHVPTATANFMYPSREKNGYGCFLYMCELRGVANLWSMLFY